LNQPGKIQQLPANTATIKEKRSNIYVQNNPQAVANVTQKASNLYRPSGPIQSNVYPSAITFQKESGISDGDNYA